jgi:hypothetical protein
MLTKEQYDHILQWADDLEKNKDLQGRSHLYNKMTGKFCCLGRACVVSNIVDLEEINLIALPKELSDKNRNHKLKAFFGFDIESEEFVLRDEYGGESEKELAPMNDDGVSFTVIANLLRKYAKNNYVKE